MHARYVEHMHYEDLNNGQCKNRFHWAIRMYSDNAQRASQRGKNICHASTSLYYHVLTSSMCNQHSTEARPNEIFFLNNELDLTNRSGRISSRRTNLAFAQ